MLGTQPIIRQTQHSEDRSCIDVLLYIGYNNEYKKEVSEKMNIITNAKPNDKAEILALYKTMLYGPADWNEYYPSEDTIDFDLSRNALYVMKNDAEQIIAAISVDKEDDVEKLECWNRELMPAAELSRVCVRKDMQNRGIAKQMMRYVFEMLKKEGKKSVHILVRAGHKAALSSYSAIGFHIVGECHLYDKDFICMEIEL